MAGIIPKELYSSIQVRNMDRIAIENYSITGYDLMQRAGQAAFELLISSWPQAKHIAVICGNGNNGGDGFVVARLAKNYGLDVTIINLCETTKLIGEALLAWNDAYVAGVPNIMFNSQLNAQKFDVIVDAIFGTGLHRKVYGIYDAAINFINKQLAILSIDVPSGLDADTGTICGNAVYASQTITFVALKQGLFTGAGPLCCGQISFSNLGIPAKIFKDFTPTCLRYCGDDLSTLLPRRLRNTHKGNFGHVLVVGGDLGYSGAVRMAAEAAARCGAGLVSVATHHNHAGLHAAIRPELMFHGVEKEVDLLPLLERATVIAIGPGLGRQAWGLALFRKVISTSKPLVVDADALHLLTDTHIYKNNWILTPHAGEAAKLLKITRDVVDKERISTIRQLTNNYGGVSVLKGSGSLVQKVDEIPIVINTGNPGMASGGMGDVLTGIIAGLLSQGLEPLAAAKAAVYLHGLAGDIAAQSGGERGLLATDILKILRKIVNFDEVS